MLTAERLREVLDYNAETGIFTWRVRTSCRVKVGSAAGYLHPYGYTFIRLDGHLHRAHRLVWLYVYGVWPSALIDHIDCDPTNTRIANLREATHSQNHQNMRKPRRDNKTGFLGVSIAYGKYKAQIRLDGKNRSLGVYDTPEAAHEAYLVAKRKLHSHNTL